MPEQRLIWSTCRPHKGEILAGSGEIDAIDSRLMEQMSSPEYSRPIKNFTSLYSYWLT